jgi:RNA polymerase sigma factor (sigma-70 family)
MPVSNAQLQELWLKYYPIVKGRIIDKVQDATAVEDIAGEVFLGLVELVKKDGLRDDTKLESILFTITSRKIYDWMREKYKNQPLTASNAVYQFITPSTVVGDYEAKEFSANVMTSVTNLTERQQQAFMMMVVNGTSRADTAETLNVSESRVQHLVTRAKERVADDLAKVYFPDPDNGQGELSLWADKFYMAYLRLALKSGKLTDEIEENARNAWVKIKQKLEA